MPKSKIQFTSYAVFVLNPQGVTRSGVFQTAYPEAVARWQAAVDTANGLDVILVGYTPENDSYLIRSTIHHI